MDLRALLHNKFALAGVGVAAAAGLVVFLRKKNAAGGGGSSTGAQASPGYSGGVGGFDSTGTDVAAQLGQYQANTQVILDQYQKQLTDALTGLAQVTPGTTGTGTGPTDSVGPRSVSIGKGTNVYDFAAGNGTSLDQLRSLNPGLDKLITWVSRPGTTTKDPLITKGLPLRVS